MNKRNYQQRYGNVKRYKKTCAIAHKSVYGLCCVCLTRTSEELHHAKYGQDEIGKTIFPVCVECHQLECHSKENWIYDPKNPVWGNRNTAKFIERLQLGYQLLYGGINHDFQTTINPINQ